MDCPQCQTPNPIAAARCQRCNTPLPIDAATLVDAADKNSDPSLTLDNWSAASTTPSLEGPSLSSGELKSGNVLASRYEIISRLGGGGMGTVYKATDREVERLVALKVIRAELAGNSDILSRFKQELILARKVTHRNVIRIFDLGRAHGIRYITMEYIEGLDLRSFIKQKGKLSHEESVEIMQQVCLALDAAHAEGVVHRDLKPQNIMIDNQGRAVVMDFGIARSVGGDGLTMTGVLVGTPDYMSPEQVKGDEVDGRSDIFTLGIIFYELLTGKMPFRAETVQRSMYKRTIERSTPAKVEDSTVPPYLSEVVSKCLELNPAVRYQTARELWADLESWRKAPEDQSGTVLPRKLERMLRNRVFLAATGIALLLLVGGYTARHWLSASTVSKKTEPAVPARALAVFPFRNASGDTKLDWLGSSLGEMLTNDIGQSADMRTISEARISQVLHDLRITPDSHLDPATLDQLSEFTNADIIVWGEYAKFGDELRIDATLADRKNGTQQPITVQAANEKEVLKTVDSLAKQIRQHLTVSSAAIGELETTAFKPSSTSVEALRDYERGLQFQHLGKNLDALDAFNSSIKEDPKFALAYSKLAESYAKAGRDDQAQTASLKAVGLSEKLPTQEKYLIRATHAEILKEYPKAIESYEALAKRSPGDSDVLLRLADLYEKSGNLDQARTILEKVHTIDPKSVPVLLAEARVELKSNNPQKGLQDLNSALTLSIQLGNDEQKANILQAIGVGYEDLQRPEDALHNYQESLDIKRRLGMKSGIASSLHAIANIQNATGKPDLALKNFMESLNIRREIGDKAGIGDVLIDMGVFYGEHGQPDEALKLYKESLQIQIDLGNEQNRGLLLNNIGAIYLDKGDYQDARTFYEQALQIRLKFKVPADIAETRHNLGETAANLGLYEQALDQYHQALDLQRKVGNKQMIAIENSSLGTVFSYQGRYGAALSAKEDAFRSFRDLGEKSLWTVIIDGGYGEALAQVGQHEEAKKILDEAMGLARELKNQDEIARTMSFQGDNAYFSGDLKTARQFYAQALSISAKSSDVRLVLSAKFNLAKLDVNEGHAQAALKQLTALAGEADKVGFKYLSLQASLCSAQAQIQLKNFSKAGEILETVMVQTDKLGLLSLKGQAHALLAKALEREHKPAEAERERNAAQQLFQEIQAEGHFDLRSRYDLASSLN
jgi:tetratricopeptide (TPR) repeat protein/predicted Ser/Thr protein kinase